MRFAYMVATPEVRGSRVTAWRGELEAAFAAVARAGFQGVELMIRDPQQQDPEQLLSLSANHALTIPVLCTGEIYGEDGLSFADPDPAVRAGARERARAMVELAVRLGADVNVGRLRGRYTNGVHPEQTLEWIREGLRTAAAVSPSVRILLEPINRKVTNCILTTAEGLAFVRDLALPNVNLMLDTMQMEAEGENLRESFAAAASQCFHVHIGQSDRLPPGTGTYDLGPVIEALNAIGYRRWVGVEVWQEPDQETALRLSAQALRRYVI